MSWLFTSGVQSIEASTSASVLPMNIKGWFPLGLADLISLLSKGLSRVFSNTTVWKHQPFLYGLTLMFIHDYWKKIKALTIWTFFGKVMSLLFYTLSRFIVAFLPRSKGLLISWLQSLSAVTLESKKIVCHCFYFSPSICHEVMGLDAMILAFWMLSFKPTFALSSFTFIKRLFSSSLLSAIRVVSSAYLRLLIFLPAVSFPAYTSSSPAFCMIYSAYKLNKQDDNMQPWHTPFPIWKQSNLGYVQF